jgi:hypothetical protein
LQNIFQWLNTNEGVLEAIAALLSFFTCIAAFASAKAARNSADAARDQVREMQRQYEKENRPIIEVEFIYEKRAFFGLRFINCGKFTAKDVKIMFDKNFIDSLPESNYAELLRTGEKKTRIIGTGCHYDLFFGSNIYLNAEKKPPAKGHVIYYSTWGKEYYYDFDIPLENYASIYSVNSEQEDLLDQMKKQTDELKNMRRALEYLPEAMKNQNSDENASK